MSGDAIFWLCATSFLAGYCVGEIIRFIQEIWRHRAAKRNSGTDDTNAKR